MAQPTAASTESPALPDQMPQVPLPPQFADVADERSHRQQRLAAGFRILAKRGLTTGIAGHISVRDPEHPDRFWVNSFSMPFSRIKVSDLIQVDEHGNVLHGDQPVNPAAFAIHSRVHKANPHLNAACHSHTPWGRPWSATGRLIEPTSQDACTFYGAQHLVEDFSGVVLGLDVGDQIAQAFQQPTGGEAGVTVVIHANHGHITAGETVDEAIFWFVLFEQMCESQMRLEATGRPYHVLDHQIAAETNALTGNRYTGWLSFQSMYEEIVAEQPDLLD